MNHRPLVCNEAGPRSANAKDEPMNKTLMAVRVTDADHAFVVSSANRMKGTMGDYIRSLITAERTAHEAKTRRRA